MAKFQIPAKAIAIGAACLSITPCLFWVYRFWALPFSDDQQSWNHFGTFIGGTVSPLLSLAAFAGLLLTVQQAEASAKQQARQAQSEEQGRQAETDATRLQALAERCWSRAYDTINDRGQPARNRLAWLNCARLLLAGDKAIAQISSTQRTTLQIAHAEKSHWQSRFYDLLDPVSTRSIGMTASFFQEDASEYRTQIEERSIRVIYEFIQWRDDEIDSIESVPKYTAEELDSLPPTMLGIRQYIQQMPRFRTPRAQQVPMP